MERGEDVVMAKKVHRIIIGSVGALALLVASCGSSDEAADTAAEITKTEVTTSTELTPTAPTPTTEVVVEDTTPAEAEPAIFDPDAMPLTTQFEFLDEGVYRVDTIGTPFSFEVTDALFVYPNSDALFVVGHPNGQGPDDRDLVFFRVSDLSDPAQPAAAPEDQEGWPANDIEGWLDAVGDEIVISNRAETAVGGRSGLRFDMKLSDDAECGEDFCVGFATNRLVNGKSLEPRSTYRTWWIDEGDESPIAIIAGIKIDSAIDWFDTAESILESAAFGDAAPNPIPADGDLWTLGFSTDVPAGTVELPALGGIRFELSEDSFIWQDSQNGVAGVLLGDVPADSEFLFVGQNGSGGQITTTDLAVAELTDAGVTVTEVETTTVGGFPTRVVDAEGEGNVSPLFVATGADPGATVGWSPPTAGRLWLIESDRGLVMITAEAFGSIGPLEDVIAQTASIISTLEFIELN